MLRPGGVVGLGWNIRDDRVPWVGALGEVLPAEIGDHAVDDALVQRFAEQLTAHVEEHISGVIQRIGSEQVVAGVGTPS